MYSLHHLYQGIPLQYLPDSFDDSIFPSPFPLFYNNPVLIRHRYNHKETVNAIVDQAHLFLLRYKPKSHLFHSMLQSGILPLIPVRLKENMLLMDFLLLYKRSHPQHRLPHHNHK